MSKKSIGDEKPMIVVSDYEKLKIEESKIIKAKDAEIANLNAQLITHQRVLIETQGHVITLIKALGRVMG